MIMSESSTAGEGVGVSTTGSSTPEVQQTASRAVKESSNNLFISQIV
jgi:hypothetical protein